MYKITSTTDGKYIGTILDDISNPVNISEDLSFIYEKKIEVGNEITLSNSNYIIHVTIINHG